MKTLLSVNVTSIIHYEEWSGSVGKTGIDKRPKLGRVAIENDGVEGDSVLDTKNHGGKDQAVYAYAREDADWWEKEIGIEIANGRFGENLTTSGVDVTNAIIGEIWKIGNTTLQVTMPRIPCKVFLNPTPMHPLLSLPLVKLMMADVALVRHTNLRT